MKSAHIVTANRPMKELVTFGRAFPMTAAMKPFGGCASAPHLTLPASYQWLDRNVDQVNPGEGSA